MERSYRLELCTVLSTDKLELPGLLYTPKKRSKRAAIWLHGMGDNGIFYKPLRMNELAEALAVQHIALLAFNNRGAHNSKRIRIADDTLPEDERSYLGGTYFETIQECVHDIDGAVALLRERGYEELYLIGHSSGANKICVYNFAKSVTPFSKYILAAPGDDLGLFRRELGPKKYHIALQYAQHAISRGEDYKIMPKYSGMYPFSSRSAYDILNPNGAYNTFPFCSSTSEQIGEKRPFSEYSSIAIPTLVVIGSNDEYTATADGPQGALDILLSHTSNQQLKHADFMLIHDADHGFNGQERTFAATVANWLSAR